MSLLAWPIALVLAVVMGTWGYHTPLWIDLILFVVTGRVGTAIGSWSISSWIAGRRHLAASELDVQRLDARPPVLYLRSFYTDELTSHTVPGHGFATYRTEEQQVTRAFEKCGPVLALGRPGEKLPMLGAARSYAPDAEWQRVVLDMMRKAGLVLISAGRGEALMWEIEQAVALVPPDKIVILIPFDYASYEKFRAYSAPHFGRTLPDWIHEYRKASTVLRAAVYFDPDWTGHFVRLDIVKRRSIEMSCYDVLGAVYRRYDSYHGRG
jgi:hypothetical protein